MKIFAIIGLALAASSLANGLALKGSRLSSQQQEQLSPAGLSEPHQEEIMVPTPYQFSYDTQSEGGQSSRSESGDASGKVIGQYAIKGADGIQRLVSYTADSEGFRANISTNEPGTESQNPSFIVLQSSQLPASEISRQLQTDMEQHAPQEDQPIEEPADLPQQAPLPARSIAAPPRKTSAPAKTIRKQQPAIRQPAQISVPTKGRRPSQQPAKRAQATAATPSKGGQRIRAPSKSAAAPTSTTAAPQRELRAIQAPVKRPPPARTASLPLQQEQPDEEPAQLAEQVDDAVEDESQDAF